MAKKIRRYLKYIDKLLEENNTNFELESEKHLVQIGFWQHERLIHLIVTVTFALLTIAVFLFVLSNPQPMLFLLLLFLLILLVPYIKHYYLLENGVQKMYEQYDEMIKRKLK